MGSIPSIILDTRGSIFEFPGNDASPEVISLSEFGFQDPAVSTQEADTRPAIVFSQSV